MTGTSGEGMGADGGDGRKLTLLISRLSRGRSGPSHFRLRGDMEDRGVLGRAFDGVV